MMQPVQSHFDHILVGNITIGSRPKLEDQIRVDPVVRLGEIAGRLQVEIFAI